MTNGDLTKSVLYNRRWFYDEMIDRLGREAMSLRTIEQDYSKFGINKIESFPSPSDEVVRQMEIIKDYRQQIQGNIQTIDHNLSFMQSLHPFIIGPSTLESLMNQQPTNYEYVRESKLPFNELFFEFAEPISFPLPFYNSDRNLRGMALCKSNLSESNQYWMKLYYSDSPKDIAFMSTFMNLENRTEIQGKIASLPGENFANNSIRGEGIYGFIADLNSGLVDYCTHNEDQESIRKTGESLLTHIKGGKENFSRTANFEDVGNPQVFNQIANLSVNLVNYINAHNVTIVQKEREATYLDKRPNGKNKKRIERRPYNLIVLNDSTIYRYKGQSEKTWDLQERIFVRGHNRRFPLRDLEVPERVWIPPHIKGPENAPFREQRYQVLYEKLGREVQMFRDLGLRHDSEMWKQ